VKKTKVERAGRDQRRLAVCRFGSKFRAQKNSSDIGIV